MMKENEGHRAAAADHEHAHGAAGVPMQGGNQLIIAELGGEVVACLQLAILPGLSRRGATRAQMEGVRVRSDLRGRGIGEALIQCALDRARAQGCRLAQLTTDRLRPEALRFYERLGFAATHIGMKMPLG